MPRGLSHALDQRASFADAAAEHDAAGRGGESKHATKMPEVMAEQAEGIVIGAKNGKRMLFGANDGRVEAGAAIGY